MGETGLKERKDMNFLGMGGLGALGGLFGKGQDGGAGGGMDLQGMLGLKPFHEQLKGGGFIGSLINGNGIFGGDKQQQQQPQGMPQQGAPLEDEDAAMKRLAQALMGAQQGIIGR
jgi:hypothetical protein